MKKDILKILDLVSFFLIVAATVLVVIFEFAGGRVLMQLALILYFVGLLVLSVFFVIRICLKVSKKGKADDRSSNSKSEKEQNESSQAPKDSPKSNWGALIAMFVFSLVALIFTLVVLILY